MICLPVSRRPPPPPPPPLQQLALEQTEQQPPPLRRCAARAAAAAATARSRAACAAWAPRGALGPERHTSQALTLSASAACKAGALPSSSSSPPSPARLLLLLPSPRATSHGRPPTRRAPRRRAATLPLASCAAAVRRAACGSERGLLRGCAKKAAVQARRPAAGVRQEEMRESDRRTAGDVWTQRRETWFEGMEEGAAAIRSCGVREACARPQRHRAAARASRASRRASPPLGRNDPRGDRSDRVAAARAHRPAR